MDIIFLSCDGGAMRGSPGRIGAGTCLSCQHTGDIRAGPGGSEHIRDPQGVRQPYVL